MPSTRRPAPEPAENREPRHAWTFSALAILLGCVATAFVFTVLMFLLLGTDPSTGMDLLGSEESAARMALSTGGFALVGLLVVGPTTAYFISYFMRRESQVSRHLVAFGAAGLVIGFGIGVALGGPSLGMTMAPMFGVSAAVGRLVVQPLARL